jgi:glycosyltransferase involved in cell wall biosynthesis
MQKSPTVGVAMATYNGARYLEAQLESIGKQTRPPDLLVVSDDGSTDSTADIVRAFTERSPFPVIFLRAARPAGVIGNFMRAFEQCRTDYIAYCDQDDVWHPDKLQACMSVAEASGPALIFHRSELVDASLNRQGQSVPKGQPAGRYVFPHFPDFLWGFGHQMVFSQQTFQMLVALLKHDQNGIPIVANNLDRGLLIAAGCVGEIHFINRDLIQFRRHTASVSTAGKSETASKGLSSQDTRRQTVEKHFGLLVHLTECIQHNQDMAPALEQPPALALHAQWLLQNYTLRRDVYRERRMHARLGAVTRLLARGAYGSVRHNRIPVRHLLLDVLRCFRG